MTDKPKTILSAELDRLESEFNAECAEIISDMRETLDHELDPAMDRAEMILDGRKPS